MRYSTISRCIAINSRWSIFVYDPTYVNLLGIVFRKNNFEFVGGITAIRYSISIMEKRNGIFVYLRKVTQISTYIYLKEKPFKEVYLQISSLFITYFYVNSLFLMIKIKNEFHILKPFISFNCFFKQLEACVSLNFGNETSYIRIILNY